MGHFSSYLPRYEAITILVLARNYVPFANTPHQMQDSECPTVVSVRLCIYKIFGRMQ